MTVRNQVLVVDDDDDLRETIVEILADTGFDVRQAENGAAALTWLRETHGTPSVILLDLMMPGMNGWEFREAQLRDARLGGIAGVGMTASRDLKGIQANAVLSKPVTLDDLVKAVARYAPQPDEPARDD